MTLSEERTVARSPLSRFAASSVAPYLVLLALTIALLVFNAITEPVFFTPANITNVMRTLAIPLILAAAGTLVLLTGGVDLSMGALLGFAGIVYSQLVVFGGLNSWVALLLTLLVAVVVGLFVNGYLVGRVGMNFFVVTLGTASLLRGLAYLWTGGAQTDMAADPLAAMLGDTAIFGGLIPVSFLVSFGAVVVLWLILRFTTYGRSIYAVGGNREAAELSGVRGAWVIASTYGIVALCAAIAGIMTIGRVTLADPNAGAGVELTVIAGIMLGGVALTGGVGSVWGAALGITFLSILSNSLGLRGLNNNWQLVLTGGILILAVLFDRWRQRAAGR